VRLKVADIYFSYNSHPVLSNVSFCLERGQIMCVLGVNGAGKSTLLKCLNRILEPHRGTVLLDGADLSSMNHGRIAQLIAYVPQRYPESGLTVFESVLMGRKPHIRWSMGGGNYALAETIIRQIGLEHLAMRPISTLSGGELQKVVIARALAQSPQVLLLDEPTSNLDLKNQLEVMELIRKIVKQRGLSAVAAIHDLNMALRFADSYLFLKDGRIYAVAGKEELTAETIRQVYGVDVELVRIGNHMVVVPA